MDSRDQLEGIARYQVIEGYSLRRGRDDLELVSDTGPAKFDAAAWHFRFRHDDWYYEVTLIEDTGPTRVVRLGRGRVDHYGP